MQINKVAFIGKGGVGLLYGSMIAKALGNDVEYVMDDARFERHAGDALTVNGKPCDLTSVRASEAAPADLVILTVKTTGLDQALKTMERVVGPNTLIASLCNGITSEQKIAERFGWEHTVLGICQGMDAVFLSGELTFTNAGEIRFGAAAGTKPATVTAIDEPLYALRHRPYRRERHCAPHVGQTHAQRRHQPDLHGLRRDLRKRHGAGLGAAPLFCLRHARDACGCQRRGVELTEADLTQMVHLIEESTPPVCPRWRRTASHNEKPKSRSSRAPFAAPASRQTRYPSAAKRLALPEDSRNRKQLVVLGIL